jgi:hypothetical protein
MKIAYCLLLTGFSVLLSCGSASAFGRGGAVAGARVGPAGGVQAAGAARGVSTGPLGGVHSTNVAATSRTGPGGASVQHVGGNSVSRGPLGGVSAQSAGATRVTTPGGNTVTRTNTAGAKVGPAGGVKVGASSSAAVRTPTGTGAAVTNRGGVAVGPYGGVRAGSTSTAAVHSPFGGTAVSTRSGVAVAPVGAVGGVKYGAVGHTTKYVSPNTVRASGVVVRSGYAAPVFTPSFYTVHTNAWVAPRTVVGVSYWRPPVYATTAAFIGLAATTPPIVYDYGSTVVIQNEVVYVNGEQIASAAEYSAQASQIVDTGRQAKPAQNEEWQPLGVFGLIQEDEKVAQRIFQLAVNKDGIVNGNYYDAVADYTLRVVGSVDKKTQRVAWSIGEKKDIVFETGLSNLTNDESTVLVHYGKDNTQQMILVRLEEPTEAK